MRVHGKIKRRGILLIISAPSGAGKTTIIRRLLAKNKKTLAYSVSATTRAKRKGERHGKDYFFLSEADFQKKVQQKQFLEWAEVFGNCYGTLCSEVERSLEKGKDVLVEIDVQGARQLRSKSLDAVFIFILPPSLKELKSRLAKRATETVESFKRRFCEAKNEIKSLSLYDYVVINQEVKQATALLEHILEAERHKVSRKYRKLCKD